MPPSHHTAIAKLGGHDEKVKGWKDSLTKHLVIAFAGVR